MAEASTSLNLGPSPSSFLASLMASMAFSASSPALPPPPRICPARRATGFSPCMLHAHWQSSRHDNSILELLQALRLSTQHSMEQYWLTVLWPSPAALRSAQHGALASSCARLIPCACCHHTLSVVHGGMPLIIDANAPVYWYAEAFSLLGFCCGAASLSVCRRKWSQV